MVPFRFGGNVKPDESALAALLQLKMLNGMCLVSIEYVSWVLYDMKRNLEIK